MTLTAPIEQTERLIPLTYDRANGINLVYGEPVAFIPTPDSPAGFDLNGEYYGTFDACRITQTRTGERVQVLVIRQSEALWLPMENVFKLPNAAERIPGIGARL